MLNSKTINTWRKFSRCVKFRQDKLLLRLDDFPNSILIAGCQRSGTTMLARIITQSEGMVNYWFGPDDELDAALILSGHEAHQPRGRYCFQTTYLNERYPEYFEHENFRMVWILRNPHSVVHSMLHNWKDFALNNLFSSCAAQLVEERYRRRHEILGIWVCLGYCVLAMPTMRRQAKSNSCGSSRWKQVASRGLRWAGKE